MKHLFLTLLGLLSLLTLHAQSPYYPMLNDSNIWQVHGTVRLGGQGEIIHGCEGYYTLEGDTLFKGQLYKRIYSLGKVVLYFFREDTITHKIYIINRRGNVSLKHKGDTVEQVYFDFNMQAGDSMRSIGYRYDSIPYWIKVVNLDSIQFIDGTWRQRYELALNGGNWGCIGATLGVKRYVIEGMGSLHGVDDFYSISPAPTFVGDGYSQETIALWRYGVQLWSIGYDCSAFGIKENTYEQEDMSIIPNPFHGQAQINFSSRLIPVSYTIYNLTGQAVKQQLIENGNYILDAEELAAGSYLLQCQYTNQQTSRHKILVY